jgi:hypothetical protein
LEVGEETKILLLNYRFLKLPKSEKIHFFPGLPCPSKLSHNPRGDPSTDKETDASWDIFII